MKNRNLNHQDDWATPPYFYNGLNKKYNFDFDPCPFQHNLDLWDGLEVDWGLRNYINPPYSRKLKEKFIHKAVEESKKGKFCLMLLPVSTSTKIFHDVILPNKSQIEFVKGRIPFIGINSKDQYVNWHLWDLDPPEGAVEVKNSGMHDSMLVTFGSYEDNKDWNSIKKQPPNELIEVMDENGNIAKALPTYYTFKTGENKTGRKWGTEIIHTEPYWDGGWMISYNTMEQNIDSQIIKWRKIK
ncbi:MAG: DNA N-6-adenine-methyltransferase [bacterium]